MYKENFKVILPEFPNVSVDIRDFGASADVYAEDGKVNAKAINDAINQVSSNDGGKVVVPAGIWVTGPITLKDNAQLHLEKGAILKFSKNMDEYPLIVTNYEGQECIRTVSPINADGAVNIAITGKGVIDGSGDLWRPVKQFKMTERQWNNLLKKSDFVIDTKEGGIWLPTESAFVGNEKNIQKNTDTDALAKAESYYDFYRPVMVSLKHCDKVLIDGVTLMNSPAWNVHPFFCTNLTVRNATIRNQYYAQNGDGIDVESCNGVEIYDCLFETGDDAICMKAGKGAEARAFEGSCENVYIHDCIVNEGHGGFVVGSEMSRGVRHVLVENCSFIGTDVGTRFKSAVGRGGTVEDIVLRNINMLNIKQEAIIMTMSYSLNSLNRDEKTAASIDESDIPYFRDITFENINCMGAKCGVKTEPVIHRRETIENIRIINCNFNACEENVLNDAGVVIE